MAKIKKDELDELIAEALQDNIELAIEPETKLQDGTLNACSETLIALLEGDGANLMRETAAQYNIPLWMQVVGCLQRVIDRGWHTSPALGVAWLSTLPVVESPLFNAKCKECNESFTRRWPGQQYCSNTCGSVADRKRAITRSDELKARNAFDSSQRVKLSSEAIEGNLGVGQNQLTNEPGGTFDVAEHIS